MARKAKTKLGRKPGRPAKSEEYIYMIDGDCNGLTYGTVNEALEAAMDDIDFAGDAELGISVYRLVKSGRYKSTFVED